MLQSYSPEHWKSMLPMMLQGKSLTWLNHCYSNSDMTLYFLIVPIEMDILLL